MRSYGVLVISLLMGLVLFATTSCEQSTSTTFEESFQDVKQVTPIQGAQNTTMELQHGDQIDSFFSVKLGDGITREGWCIEWGEPASFGLNEGTKLYSTKGHEEWKELNYFMSIKDELKATDPDLTYKEIQVVIWSLIDKPTFDVDRISDYQNISERIYKDGQPQFDVTKVKNIVNQVDTYFASAKGKSFDNQRGVYFIENDGQTVMFGDQTAYAVKTKEDGSVDDLSHCFIDNLLIEGENISFGNWGWTNGPISDPSGELSLDIYAGAGQCDLSKGTLVGELIVNYSDGTLTVTYKMTEISPLTSELYTMTETHLYAGNLPYPTNMGSGKFAVAPGQYGNQSNHNYVTEYTYEIGDLEGDIYFIAHAVVYGFPLETE